jgi:uncharacterized tellurite resistance protein B-like protein
MADRLGQIEPLAKMASPDFCQRYEQTFQPFDGQRTYPGECAVGSVDARGVLQGEQHDSALVEIRWSGTYLTAGPQGANQRAGRSLLVKNLFVMIRKRGVATDVGRSVSSSHCPACGAPETNIASHACEFCGEVLNDGSHDWVLDTILNMSDSEAQELLGRVRSQPTSSGPQPVTATLVDAADGAAGPRGTELLSWIVKMALADQQLDEKERQLLQQVARHRHVPQEQVETLIRAAEQGQLETPEPAGPEQAREWLVAMADMSLSDGRVTQSEYQLLCQAGAPLNMSAYDVKRLLRQRRTHLVQTARQRIREARQID